MADVYTMGTWIVKDGEEEAFVEAWTEFVQWGSTLSGSGTLRLARDLDEPSRLSASPTGRASTRSRVEGHAGVPGAHGRGAATRGRVHAERE